MPPAQPATARLKAKMDERIAYSVVALARLVMAIRKARKAPVPRPPVKLSRALAAYTAAWWASGKSTGCTMPSAPGSARGTTQAAAA